MLVKTIIDNEKGKKWEINKIVDEDGDCYIVSYFEFYQSVGWRELRMGPVECYRDKETLEWEYDIKIA